MFFLLGFFLEDLLEYSTCTIAIYMYIYITSFIIIHFYISYIFFLHILINNNCRRVKRNQKNEKNYIDL